MFGSSSPANPPDQPPDEGLSLDKLNQAFAAMLGSGDDPYAAPVDADDDPLRAAFESEIPVEAAAPSQPRESSCEISPTSILEAMLMVGLPDNVPLTAQQIAGLMRGVRPMEIEDLVRDLNAQYSLQNRPYFISSQGAGFRMTLREEFSSVRDRFAGRIKEARLSPAAIEVLAIVAYNEPLTAEAVTGFRGSTGTSILAQLVRRQLLCIERNEAEPRIIHYRTTDRFLKMFGVTSVADMPRSVDLDRQ